MAILSNAVEMIDAGSFSASLGSMTHIKTLTASGQSTLNFVNGASSVVLDDTYPIYKFEYTNLHPSANGDYLRINFSIDTGSNYNVAKHLHTFIVVMLKVMVIQLYHMTQVQMWHKLQAI